MRVYGDYKEMKVNLFTLLMLFMLSSFGICADLLFLKLFISMLKVLCPV